MKCVCCGVELSNNLDTFGDVGIEMCWSCWSELWQDRIYRVFAFPHDIWGIVAPDQTQGEHPLNKE